MSLSAAVNALQFSGIDDIHFNVVNGADRTSRTWYNCTGSSRDRGSAPLGFQPFPFSLVEELGPLAATANISLLPVITSLDIPTDPHITSAYNITDSSFQFPADGHDWVRAFGDRVPDPLRPEVQKFMRDLVVEAAKACASQPAVRGIGVRVNGKIGFGYIAWQGTAKNGSTLLYPAKMAGYSAWNVAQFAAASGVSVPDETNAYTWLSADPVKWKAWLDYRCRSTVQFWARMADEVRAVRADWKLHIITDLPAEVPATNVQWPGPDDPAAAATAKELLRAHGFDPTLWSGDEASGLVVERTMMTDADEFWAKWGPPWGTNPSRYRDFHEQTSVLPLYSNTAAGGDGEVVTSVYSNYWETPFWPQGEFGILADGSGLRTVTASQGSRGMFRALCFAMRRANSTTLSLMAWDRATLGHEHDVRRFAAAYRALPIAPAKVAAQLDLGYATLTAVTATASPDIGDDLWFASFGDHHLAVMNDGIHSTECVCLILLLTQPFHKETISSEQVPPRLWKWSCPCLPQSRVAWWW